MGKPAVSTAGPVRKKEGCRNPEERPGGIRRERNGWKTAGLYFLG